MLAQERITTGNVCAVEGRWQHGGMDEHFHFPESRVSGGQDWFVYVCEEQITKPLCLFRGCKTPTQQQEDDVFIEMSKST
mgnify:CR=1 FL=1